MNLENANATFICECAPRFETLVATDYALTCTTFTSRLNCEIEI